MDVPRLIAEIHKRPSLWDMRQGEHKGRNRVTKMWQEVSVNIEYDVDQCKRKWKNLRDAYRAEVKRSERRTENAKSMGTYDSNVSYKSKWVYFQSLTFLDVNESAAHNSIDNENINLNDSNDESNNDSHHSVADIKIEPNHDTNEELQNLAADEEEYDEVANDILFEEFQNIATSQAARRLSATLSTHLNSEMQENPVSQQKGHSDDRSTASTTKQCKCSKGTDDQVHFLEDLGREEQKLIKSTRQDITRSNKLDHVGDSDYNFLVSFLPQMKKMPQLQNLQFRARMCDMVLNIMAPNSTALVSHNTNAVQLTQGMDWQRATGVESVNTVNSTNHFNLN